MRITEKGQVTIPKEIRRKTGLLPHTDVEFRIDGQNVIMRKAAGRRRGNRLIAAMKGRATTNMTTDEIMAMTRGD